MASLGKTLGAIVLPKRASKPAGTAVTATYQPSNNAQVLAAPSYNEHTTDLTSSRKSQTSKELLQTLFQHDPDISAAVNAYQTVADTPMIWLVKDQEGKLDREGWALVDAIIRNLTTRNDYTLGFQLKPSIGTIAEELRYMVLLRGACAAEAVMDKLLQLAEIRNIDVGSLKWFEKSPGVYKPVQSPSGGGDDINLDVPGFFVSFYRRDPTKIYTNSGFVSAINTIAARQMVINELFRLMQVTGYPRISIKVMEEVLLKNAPADAKINEDTQRKYVNNALTTIANQFGTLRSDQPFATTDSVEVSMLNEKSPAASLDITHVIEVLNGQNQAALKVMATVIGRGESGVNTASVEARIFSMNADDLNDPVADLLSNIFTLALRLSGSASSVEVKFLPSELRPATELENQLMMRQDRVLTALSYGMVTDEEAHLWLFNRLPPEGAPILSGTGFYTQKIDATGASPNSDPLGRSLTPKGSAGAKSNSVGANKK